MSTKNTPTAVPPETEEARVSAQGDKPIKRPILTLKLEGRQE